MLKPNIRLYNCDYRDVARINFCDAIISDPPYDKPCSKEELLAYANGNILVFCAPENQYFKPDEYAFWYKTPSTKNYIKKLGRFIEMILILRQGDTFNQLHWSQMTGVYDDRLVEKPEHPYEKPLSLIERLIRIYTAEGNVIFDPFMGSGTVALACWNLGRHYIGCEIDEAKFAIAVRKLVKNNVAFEQSSK